MGKMIAHPTSRNAQLSAHERTCVYFSRVTGRILGFGHESMTPLYKEGWKREILYHAAAIDKYAELFRKQEEEDRQSVEFDRSEREAPARAAIKAALRARRDHVSPMDRAYIDANLKLIENREARFKNRKEQAYLLCERYEGDPRPEDIALDSPAFAAKE
jgi:hypothetical protein